ncbi:hypothetical protein TELCIR_18294 [Teladorsagia circumcincta]|uniref:Uncharacterized protein n=1 Tax=Teladorsagia circumcincta TaxID=45464 RepID=A0A2G9TQJ9_TELCI|nr:hypothetical protein TELCIR_18294 [Teladorsagia circumcincta]
MALTFHQADCDCRDWYGVCWQQGETWIDDDTWVYECDGTNATDGKFVGCEVGAPPKETVAVGENRTVGMLWHSCEANEQRLKYDSGCYYANETHPDVYLKIGEHGYNGLIKHVCDRYKDYPGRVQYYAEVRKDVHVKHPTNKGINKNFPDPADLRIKDKVERWVHESASLFIANEEVLRGKVRYLPASRRQWPSDQH